MYCPLSFHFNPNLAHLILPISSSMKSLAVDFRCENLQDVRPPGTGLGCPALTHHCLSLTKQQ
uniref:Uncharacterized protein n=1 Tax=Anguilla anguilla TaxID=7936 RepID=A0A0E9S3C0_ANGAN